MGERESERGRDGAQEVCGLVRGWRVKRRGRGKGERRGKRVRKWGRRGAGLVLKEDPTERAGSRQAGKLKGWGWV